MFKYRHPKVMEVWTNKETQNLFRIIEATETDVTYVRVNRNKGKREPEEFAVIKCPIGIFYRRHYFSH